MTIPSRESSLSAEKALQIPPRMVERFIEGTLATRSCLGLTLCNFAPECTLLARVQRKGASGYDVKLHG